MRKRVLVLLAISIFVGCSEPDQTPRIDWNTVPEPPPKKTTQLPPTKVTKPALPLPSSPSGNYPSGWMPTRSERAWSAIVIHHSATDEGNATIIDKWHRENNGWDGIGYDFVIGNGTNSGDGEVEPTYRWRGQLTGAHAGGTPGNWANEEGIGICLIGDFNRSVPSKRQMESLTRLVRFLQQRYRIPTSRIYGHREVPGGHDTDCPGKRVSTSRLRSSISN